MIYIPPGDARMYWGGSSNMTTRQSAHCLLTGHTWSRGGLNRLAVTRNLLPGLFTVRALLSNWAWLEHWYSGCRMPYCDSSSNFKLKTEVQDTVLDFS